MEGEKAEIATLVADYEGAVHSKGEIEHQHPFNDHVGRNVFAEVFVALPTFFKVADVEFRGTDEFTFLPKMAFQNRNGIVH